MDGWALLILIVGIWYFFSSRLERKQRERDRLLNEKARRQQTRQRGNTSPRRPPRTAASAKSRPKPQSRAEAWVPSFEGPKFAQPGEKGQLFGYASFSDVHSLDAPYALIDFETSGFQPKDSKILEIAVIKIDSAGNHLDQFTTLINPGDGRVGRSDIHQITTTMLKDAPHLPEIMGDLLQILDSSIVVAHNAKFEEVFLADAFSRQGIRNLLLPAIDTLWLSRQVMNLPNYKLGTVIEEFGYTFEDQHTALGDVLAMSKVVPDLLRSAQALKYPVTTVALPAVPTTAKPVLR